MPIPQDADSPLGIVRYGKKFPIGTSFLDVELWAYRNNLTQEQGGPGKATHFKNIARVFWGEKSPKPFIWHPWAEDMNEACCAYNYVGMAGSASSGKSDFGAIKAIIDFVSDPYNTMVLVTSTGLKESRKRIWGSIREYWQVVPGLPGKLVDSIGMIRLDEGEGSNPLSDKCGISLIAGDKKKEKEAIGKLVGMKNKKVILIADELPELSESLLEAAYSNLSMNPYFQMIGIGNPASHYDPFGLFITPKDGWNSVTVEDEQWETERGFCLHFDGKKSPNLEYDTDRFPIYGHKQMREHQKLGENTLSYWRMCRGFFAPEGSEQAVYAESELIKFRATEPPVWEGVPLPVAGLDPGYTNDGDRSVLYLGLFGRGINGLTQVAFDRYVLLREDVTNKAMPRNFQIAEQFKAECEQAGVLPQNAAFDATGAGGPFGDIVSQVWSPLVFRSQFGGKATEREVSEFDATASSKRYVNKVSEIWFSAHEYMKTMQIKGIGPDLAREMTMRTYTTEKGGDGLRLRVESKVEMKARLNRSPDLADAAFVLFDLCRDRLHISAGRKAPARTKSLMKDWTRFAKRLNAERTPELNRA